MDTPSYRTQHMGRTFNGGWEKTICFRTTKTDDGYLSVPVVTFDNSTGSVLDFITRSVRRIDRDY